MQPVPHRPREAAKRALAGARGGSFDPAAARQRQQAPGVEPSAGQLKNTLPVSAGRC